MEEINKKYGASQANKSKWSTPKLVILNEISTDGGKRVQREVEATLVPGILSEGPS